MNLVQRISEFVKYLAALMVSDVVYPHSDTSEYSKGSRCLFDGRVLVSESSGNSEKPQYSPQKTDIYNSESPNYKKTVITKENYGSNWSIVRTAPKTEQIFKICQTITEIQVNHDTAIVEVYKNRQRLYNTLDFTANGSVITFTDDLLQGDVVLIVT